MRVAAGICMLCSTFFCLVFGVTYIMESGDFFMGSDAYEHRALERYQEAHPEAAAPPASYEPELLQMKREEAQTTSRMLGTLGPVLFFAFIPLLIAGISLLLNRGRAYVAAVALLSIFLGFYWFGVYSYVFGVGLRPGLLAALLDLVAGGLAIAGALEIGRPQPSPQ